MTIFRSTVTRSLTLLTAGVLAASLAGCEAASATPGSADTPSAMSASFLTNWSWPWEKSPAPAVPAAPAAAPGTSAAPTGSVKTPALAQLATITVKGRAPKTGYTRDQFGPAWADVDKNGCDTRNDMLRRDLTAITVQPGTKNCVIASGKLADKYTGKTISFVRGAKTSTAVQIDHIVALSDAWQKGAQQLTAEQRRQLANDPLNLFASDGPTNSAKGDSDAASFLPPNKAFRCEYAARQTAVKAKYKLWMTQAERDAIAGILNACK
ncbi:MAG TPA: HNH endonuclease family protein [Arthrobacter sp.]